jgi:4-coumarate--CoA ligase
LLWAALRLGAVPSCANPTYNATELVHQLKLSKSKFIVTHPGLIKTAEEAAAQVGIPKSKIFLIEKGNHNLPFVDVPDLIKIGERSPEIVRFKLAPGESKTKDALLNFSSGTSGLAKGVLISHYNVIANVCQMYQAERYVIRIGMVSTGCLPFYHGIEFFVPN